MYCKERERETDREDTKLGIIQHRYFKKTSQKRAKQQNVEKKLIQNTTQKTIV